MNIRKMADFFVVTGTILLGISLFWWARFYENVYSVIPEPFSGKLSDALTCLYSHASIFCGIVTEGARLAGKIPYDPLLFWGGAITLGVGLFIKIILRS